MRRSISKAVGATPVTVKDGLMAEAPQLYNVTLGAEPAPMKAEGPAGELGTGSAATAIAPPAQTVPAAPVVNVSEDESPFAGNVWRFAAVAVSLSALQTANSNVPDDGSTCFEIETTVNAVVVLLFTAKIFS